MANRPIDNRWVQAALTLKINTPRLSAAAIHRKIVAAAQGRWGKPPVSKSIERHLSKDLNKLSIEEQKPYLYFSWPESMENGALPWEAAREALDVVRWHTENWRSLREKEEAKPKYRDEEKELPDFFKRPPRIPVRQVQWFWRVTQAIPEATIEQRARTAIDFSSWSLAPQDNKKVLSYLQWHLVYQPWRSPEDEDQWRALPDELTEHPGNIDLSSLRPDRT
jgi:hypothetical protein